MADEDDGPAFLFKQSALTGSPRRFSCPSTPGETCGIRCLSQQLQLSVEGVRILIQRVLASRPFHAGDVGVISKGNDSSLRKVGRE